jgi:hypothetical protein
MVDKTSNDNNPAHSKTDQPDACGQAALLLVESLIHSLIAKSLLSVEEAVEVVDVAVDVNLEIANDLGDTAATLQKSLTLLRAISTSLTHDLPRK